MYENTWLVAQHEVTGVRPSQSHAVAKLSHIHSTSHQLSLVYSVQSVLPYSTPEPGCLFV